jgi:hypothetical protein
LTDDFDITQLEEILFPPDKPVSTWTAEDLGACGERVQALHDRYGKDRIEAMRQDLMGVNSGALRALADAIKRGTEEIKRAKNGE